MNDSHNTLAYYSAEEITAVKMYIIQDSIFSGIYKD
jgi:hypothetical protein